MDDPEVAEGRDAGEMTALGSVLRRCQVTPASGGRRGSTPRRARTRK